MGSIAVVRARGTAPDPERVRAMLAAAPHRGADLDVRVYGDAAFGVGNDPELVDAWLASENGAIAAFTGSLDNHEGLSRDLDTPGRTPAETLLAAFRAWGDEAAGRLRGAFSAAVFDGSRLLCFRDQLGYRPLFFHDDSRAFYAATEVKQVIEGAQIAREPNIDWLESRVFQLGDVDETAFRGVNRLPRASLATVDAADAVRFEPYWDPSALLETARLTVDQACERLIELTDQAVRRSMTGEDALLLSGGIDSSMIAAFAAPASVERSGRPLLALSAVFPHLPGVDERPYVELVASHLGARLETYVPQAGSLDDLPFWTRLLDGPVDTLSVPELAESYRRARSFGARTVLLGELAEYVFTLHQHLLPHLILHGRWRETARRVREQRSRGIAWGRILRPLPVSLAPPAIATRYVRLRKRQAQRVPPWLDASRLASAERAELTIAARRRWSELTLGPTGAGPASVTLEADDICAAYCGVRSRRPLTDVDLWEFVLSLRAETKFPDKWIKGLQRRALAGRLPDEIVWRVDKTDFSGHTVATTDYPALRHWILNANHRLDGIDYGKLGERLEREELEPLEINWARDVARIHAFLATFE